MPPVAKAQIDSGMEDSTAKHGFEATIWLAADPFGDSFLSGQDKREQQKSPFRVGKGNPRVKLRLQKPKQSNPTTRRLAIMNFANRGIEADIAVRLPPCPLRRAALRCQPNLDRDERTPARSNLVLPFLLACPPAGAIARRFDGLAAALMVKIKANTTESRTLATLHDTLQPKLISGELSITCTGTARFE